MTSGTLFDDDTSPDRPGAPLAARMRPRTLDDVVGQPEALAAGAPLRRLVSRTEGATGAWSSVILWGPPGSGKTTIAMLIAATGDRRFVELSAITAGVRDVREVVRAARDALIEGRPTVLFVDEVHRFSKSQQDALLPAVENGWVTLVAATTENPSFSVISPLLSRSIVVRLVALTDADIGAVLDRALTDDRGLAGRWSMDAAARDLLVRLAGGDARRGLTALEAAAASTQVGQTITVADVETAVQAFAPAYDRAGDSHYDVTSALIKSIRGSDVDAALHYLARMVVAGEDPRFIARRLVILASEDIGLADPSALTTAMSAMQAVSSHRDAGGPADLGAGGDSLGLGAKVECSDRRHRRGHGRRLQRPHPEHPSPSARRALSGRRGPRTWGGLPISARRSDRRARSAVPRPGTRRPQLLPPESPRRRRRNGRASRPSPPHHSRRTAGGLKVRHDSIGRFGEATP